MQCGGNRSAKGESENGMIFLTIPKGFIYGFYCKNYQAPSQVSSLPE